MSAAPSSAPRVTRRPRAITDATPSALACCCCRRRTLSRSFATSPPRLTDCRPVIRPGLKIEIAFDTTTVVSESIREVVTTLLAAIGLVVLVMFLFLQNWRTTLIPAITIPVSLIGTFAFVKLFGFSINTLTLFGITLATGLVVDDAIVVIENIERHIHNESADVRLGERIEPAFEHAAFAAMREVTGAVIATALVLAAVFVPVAFFPGTTGRLYQQFALTIAFSMTISAFNALTLTPALAALLLSRVEKPKGLFFRGINRVIDGGTSLLVNGLRFLIRIRFAVVARLRASAGGHLRVLSSRADWVRARRRSGLRDGRHPGTSRRVDQLHDEHRAAGRRHREEVPRGRSVLCRRRFWFLGIGAESGHHVSELEGLGRAAWSRALRAGSRRADVRRVQPDYRCDGLSVLAAVDQRARSVRRIHLRAARPERRADRQPSKRCRSTGRPGQPDAWGDGPLHAVHGERSAALREHRSRACQEPRHLAARCHRHDASAARVVVRQRFRFQQPLVSRLRPGRPAIPREARRHHALLRRGRWTAG